jgi:Uma2 family endonuclease
METVTTLPRGRALTRSDLATMPDDGHRYELVDGTLLVTPAPRLAHQRAVLDLAIRLRAACPPDLEVLVAPFAVALADDTELQPDVLVARTSDLTERDLPAPPVLAVEVLSPSTRLVDLNLKKARFEVAGTPAYWVVDPAEPRLTAWELRDGGFVEVGDVLGSDPYDATVPFAVRIAPADLVRPPGA